MSIPMSGVHDRGTRRLWRRACLIREREEAAAGVVAILLAILVVILIITLVTSVWLPVWMEEREANQIRSVTTDFGNLKATIDNLILQKDTTFIVASPIKLGTEGYSMFGSDSSGSFSINHFRDAELEYYCNVKSESGAADITATGGMKYDTRNQFYVDQSLAYENGAIILDQGDGEVVRIGPQFSVEKFGPVNSVTFVMITISGVETSIQGTSTILVQSQLVTYTQKSFYFNPSGWLYFTIITEYTTAWSRFFDNTLIEAGLIPATDYVLTVAGSTIHLDIANVQFFDMGFALIKTTIEM